MASALAMILVFNDAIWWAPFALFLLRGTRIANRLVPAAPMDLRHAVTFSAFAAILFALRPRLSTEPDISCTGPHSSRNMPSLWATRLDPLDVGCRQPCRILRLVGITSC